MKKTDLIFAFLRRIISKKNPLDEYIHAFRVLVETYANVTKNFHFTFSAREMKKTHKERKIIREKESKKAFFALLEARKDNLQFRLCSGPINRCVVLKCYPYLSLSSEIYNSFCGKLQNNIKVFAFADCRSCLAFFS